ncbi:MAG: hypothetical protein R3C11_29175 [Planctomycetaceae bacterium]
MNLWGSEFKQNENDKTLSIEIAEPSWVKLFQEALKSRFIFSNHVTGVGGPGCGGKGTISIVLKSKETHNIGISHFGFFLGEQSAPSIGSTFDSWILAKVFQDVLLEKTGIILEEKLLNNLSGINRINYQKEYYKELTQNNIDSTDDSEQSTEVVPENISHEDINRKKVELIGILGQPLLKPMTVYGQWREQNSSDGIPSKESGLLFHVLGVNGQLFDSPIILHEGFFRYVDLSGKPVPSPKHGEFYELDGWEAGNYSDIPAGIDGYNPAIYASSIYRAKYKFLPEILYVKYNKIDELPKSEHASPSSLDQNQIKTTDVGKKVKIIGLLNKPLWEIIKLEGDWIRPDVHLDQENGLVFKVLSINDEAPDEPILIPGDKFERHEVIDQVEGVEPIPAPREYDRWTLNVYETGRTWGVPKEIYKQFNLDPAAPASGFTTDINYLNVLKVETRKERENKANKNKQGSGLNLF